MSQTLPCWVSIEEIDEDLAGGSQQITQTPTDLSRIFLLESTHDKEARKVPKERGNITWPKLLLATAVTLIRALRSRMSESGVIGSLVVRD